MLISVVFELETLPAKVLLKSIITSFEVISSFNAIEGLLPYKLLASPVVSGLL